MSSIIITISANIIPIIATKYLLSINSNDNDINNCHKLITRDCGGNEAVDWSSHRKTE